MGRFIRQGRQGYYGIYRIKPYEKFSNERDTHMTITYIIITIIFAILGSIFLGPYGGIVLLAIMMGVVLSTHQKNKSIAEDLQRIKERLQIKDRNDFHMTNEEIESQLFNEVNELGGQSELVEENWDCLGCKLANGMVPTHVIHEDEWTTCILDIAPLNEGHMLILPKKHVLELDELDELTAAAIMKMSGKISRTLKEIYQPDGITVIQNGGKFNDLSHYHMHVFPRFEGDGFSWLEPEDPNNNKDRLEETKWRIINHLNYR